MGMISGAGLAGEINQRIMGNPYGRNALDGADNSPICSSVEKTEGE
jgi:hypothetical protein